MFANSALVRQGFQEEKGSLAKLPQNKTEEMLHIRDWMYSSRDIIVYTTEELVEREI